MLYGVYKYLNKPANRQATRRQRQVMHACKYVCVCCMRSRQQRTLAEVSAQVCSWRPGRWHPRIGSGICERRQQRRHVNNQPQGQRSNGGGSLRWGRRTQSMPNPFVGGRSRWKPARTRNRHSVSHASRPRESTQGNRGRPSKTHVVGRLGACHVVRDVPAVVGLGSVLQQCRSGPRKLFC